MASNNSGSKRTQVPEAREALDRFKMEVASEIGNICSNRFYRRRNGSSDD